MKVQRQIVYKRFLTKKKLFSFAWTHWGFALITTIGIGFLFTIVELIKMRERNVIFFNLRTVNSENLKINKINNEAYLNNNSPVFIFMKDKVLFGSLKNIIAPLPNNDVIILSKDWKNEFKSKIGSFKNNIKIFPAKTIGISFKDDFSYEKNIEFMKDAFETINNQNNIYNVKNKIMLKPTIVLLDSIKLF